MIFSGIRKLDEHTVIQGPIVSIETFKDLITGELKYDVAYHKMRHKTVCLSSDFDDMGNSRIANEYHYQQKSK